MRITRIAALLLFCNVALSGARQIEMLAQGPPASGDYTAALPSVEKVKAQLKGIDPTDTIARQVAVFTYLQTYISRIKDARDHGGPFTPAEQKLMGDYAVAGYQLSQEFTKSHSPAEVKAFQLLEARYEIYNALNWIKQLEGREAADTYHGAEASLAQSYKEHEEKLQNQMRQDQGSGRSSIAGDPVLDPTGMFARAEANRVNDPELRRCLELGSSLDACEGVGAMHGLGGMLFPFAGKPETNGPPPAAGVVFVGAFRGKSGLPGINFGSDLNGSPVAIVLNCGPLVTTVFDGHNYTLRKSGSAIQFVLENEPDPIVVTLKPDGTLSGPGSVLVKGRIISGHTTTTKTVMVDGAPAAPQGYDCNGPCSTSSSAPNHADKIERCMIGPMAVTPQTPTAPQKTGIKMLDAMNTSVPPVTGFRMTGGYLDGDGLKLEFQNDAVILDCGKAHAKSPYVVDNTSTGFSIRVQNGGGAFLLDLAPDNTLHGSGSTTVNGRVVSSIHGENVAFTQHSGTCGLGTLTAQSLRHTVRPSGAPVSAIPSIH